MENRSSRGTSPRVKALAAALSVALAGGACGTFAHASASPNHGATNKANWTSHAKFFSPKYDKLRAQFAAFALTSRPAPSHAPMTHTVSSRNDSGAGSLREALASAADGDVIDLRNLHGTISLVSTLQTDANIEVRGPGRDQLTIDAGGKERVFSASHGLRLSNVTLANGAAPQAAVTNGGCLYVNGRVYLENVTLTGCHAGDTTTQNAVGGAISVNGELYLQNANITDSSATATVYAGGGAVFVLGNKAAGYYSAIYNSTISGNSATVVESASSYLANGGGVDIVGSSDLVNYPSYTVIANSTITGNSASVQATYVGSYKPAAQGGAVNLFNTPALITSSQVTTNSASAYVYSFGGGVSTNAATTISHSGISSNSSTGNFLGYGGGVFAFGPITIERSSLQNNAAAGYLGVGGGLNAEATIVLTDSVVSGNTVGNANTYSIYSTGGGISRKYNSNVGHASTTITNSTISGNTTSYSAKMIGGGVYEQEALTVNNSTIAFNTSGTYGGGVATNKTATITLFSTIISNNTATTTPASADLFSYSGPITVTGDHNLVIASDTGVTLPADTLTTDPLLQPLADNGGGTLTHALGAGSPAIDAGSNPLSLSFDQRGTPYPRVVGPSADIGAYELDTDHIFGNGFE